MLFRSEEAALAGWMHNNRPDIPKMEDGLYYKIYPAGTDAKKVSLTDGVSWIYLTGLGTDLEGNYFFNMYGDIARRLGTYTELTHFVPEIYRYIESQDLTSGVYKVLPEMSVGDSIEMYCSSRWGYGSGTAEVYPICPPTFRPARSSKRVAFAPRGMSTACLAS